MAQALAGFSIARIERDNPLNHQPNSAIFRRPMLKARYRITSRVKWEGTLVEPTDRLCASRIGGYLTTDCKYLYLSLSTEDFITFSHNRRN